MISKGDEVILVGKAMEVYADTVIIDLNGSALVSAPEWACTKQDTRTEDQQTYDLYRSTARRIHRLVCTDPDECTYPDDANKGELADDPSLPWPERQKRAAARLVVMHHCQGAVESENIAAQIVRKP